MTSDTIRFIGTGDCGPTHGPADGYPIERYTELVRPTLAQYDVRFTNCERQYSARKPQGGLTTHGCQPPEMAKILHKVKPMYECSTFGMVGLSHFLDHPELMEKTVARLEAGKNGFLDAMPKGAKKSNFLTGAEEKYILSLRGICRPTMTSYYAPLSDAEQADVRAALKKFEYDKFVAQVA